MPALSRKASHCPPPYRPKWKLSLEPDDARSSTSKVEWLRTNPPRRSRLCRDYPRRGRQERTPASWLEHLPLGEPVSFGFLQCLCSALMGGKFLGSPQKRPGSGKRLFLPGRKVKGCRVKGLPKGFAGIKRQEGALTEACGNRLREGLDLASGLVTRFHQACCSCQI